MPKIDSQLHACKQCGTCCRKGGPALHKEDTELLRAGVLHYEHLLTIRKGEPAFAPQSGVVEPTPVELIKLQGRGGSWTCCFFVEQTTTCSIYAHRPLECRLLECWDTDKLLAMVNKDTLKRSDIIHPQDPILELIDLHDRECPSEKVKKLIMDFSQSPEDNDIITGLTELVRTDLAIRSNAIAKYNFSRTVEFFILGRPIFTLLAGLDLILQEKDDELFLLRSAK